MLSGFRSIFVESLFTRIVHECLTMVNGCYWLGMIGVKPAIFCCEPYFGTSLKLSRNCRPRCSDSILIESVDFVSVFSLSQFWMNLPILFILCCHEPKQLRHGDCCRYDVCRYSIIILYVYCRHGWTIGSYYDCALILFVHLNEIGFK